MNPLIKEALSTTYAKDAESEKIYKTIADFIKEYGYLLEEENTVQFKLLYWHNKRFSLSSCYSSNIIKYFESEHDEATILKILKNEGAELQYYRDPGIHYTIVKFSKI